MSVMIQMRAVFTGFEMHIWVSGWGGGGSRIRLWFRSGNAIFLPQTNHESLTLTVAGLCHFLPNTSWVWVTWCRFVSISSCVWLIILMRRVQVPIVDVQKSNMPLLQMLVPNSHVPMPSKLWLTNIAGLFHFFAVLRMKCFHTWDIGTAFAAATTLCLVYLGHSVRDRKEDRWIISDQIISIIVCRKIIFIPAPQHEKHLKWLNLLIINYWIRSQLNVVIVSEVLLPKLSLANFPKFSSGS